MNLHKPKNSQRWKNQLKRLSDCTENLFTKNLEETAINCKYFLSDIGQINYFCDEELETAVIQADVSVDGSWKSIVGDQRTVSLTFALVKLVKFWAYYTRRLNKQCYSKHELKKSGKIDDIEYLQWYVKHKAELYLTMRIQHR